MHGVPSQEAARATYREYALRPDDGRRHELIEGEFFVTPAPNSFHQTVSRRLQYALMQQLEEEGLAVVFNAPFDVILSEGTVVQPDIAVVRTERKHLVSKRGLEGAPDIAVEILSPSSRGQDSFLKRSVYSHYSVPEYWIVDPDDCWVEVLGLGPSEHPTLGYQVIARFDRTQTLVSKVFDRIAVSLTKVFAPL